MNVISIGQICISWGWIWIITGITSGSILSAWAFAGPFKAPKGHEKYDDLSRRLVRLAHISMFMLPLITIVYGEHIDSVPLTDGLKNLGAYSMIVLMLGIPTFLVLASFKLVFKYLNVIPITAGFIGLGIMAYGQWLKLG